jgi:hypothetical protein
MSKEIKLGRSKFSDMPSNSKTVNIYWLLLHHMWSVQVRLSKHIHIAAPSLNISLS